MADVSVSGLLASLFVAAFVLLPFGLAIRSSIKYRRGCTKSLAWALAGIVPGFLVLYGYYAAYTYEGTDGQAGLVFAVFPIYQLIGAGIIGAVIKFCMRDMEDDNDSDFESEESA